jgi:hypothetical protein
MINTTLTPLLSHLVFKAITECILLCVSGSIFTHKSTNSEINSITSIYYIESYYKTYYKTKRSKQWNKAPHHRQMTGGPHTERKSSSKNSSSSKEQSIAGIYRNCGKCEQQSIAAISRPRQHLNITSTHAFAHHHQHPPNRIP